jgi:hypothetical protein
LGEEPGALELKASSPQTTDPQEVIANMDLEIEVAQ